jgi:DNA polymerase-1
LRENLKAHVEQVRSNAKATPLVRDVDLGVHVEALKMGDWDQEALRTLFNFLEFRSLHDRLMEALGARQEPPPPTEPLRVEIDRVAPDQAVAILEELANSRVPIAVAAAWEREEGRSPLIGLAVAVSAEPDGWPEGGDPDGGAPASAGGDPSGRAPAGQDPAGGGRRAWWFEAGQLGTAEAAAALTELFSKDGPPLYAHRGKELMRGLDRLGIDVHSLGLDTAIAAYLLDPAETQYLLDELTARYLGLELRAPEAPPPGQLDLEGTATDPSIEAGRSAVAIAQLAPKLQEALGARGLRPLHDEIERPLVRVLSRMEKIGVRVDVAQLRELHDGLVAEGRILEAEIQALAGEPFKVNSTPQLRHILFDQLGLQPQKKTKTGFSTDAASLEKLRGLHPIIEPLLRYREVEKLRSTYGESLLAEVGDDERIHATFNQTVARTGRLSSDRPNLHNIPIRTEEGRRIRRAFIPSDGCRFLVADYNQIELRVIAHLAQDSGLIEAFATGQDIHKATAARIFDCDPESVTIGQRSKAKMVSYGLAYGMESYGLGQRLGIPTEEAAEILDAYFAGFPQVRAYMERTVAEARDRGYTETLFGRRRLIPELSSTNYRIKQAGERQAMNAGIQGLAADIFKVALVRLDGALEAGALKSRLVLQVHDEVILEVPPNEADHAAEITLDAMRDAFTLSVPLEVNLSWGDSWADAKG